MPLVSVIIPTYNRKNLLPRALQSVLNQSFTDFELIVVDDGSTDGTSELADQFPKIRLLRSELNHGVSHARNRGVAASCAKWTAFLDSDDVWATRKLEQQIKWLDAHPHFKILQSNEIWIRNGKRVNPPATHKKFQGDLFEAGLERCMITPSSVIMERSLFDETGGFDESFKACEDYDLWLRICCHHEVGLLQKELLTRYGGHEDQLSSSVPCLDKYRVESLKKLLLSAVLNEKQKTATRSNLLKRAHILAQGALKRGIKEEYDYYTNLSGL